MTKLSYALKTNNLTKNFGDFTAVSKINLQIKTGSIVGFIGPNGAGKTTAINMFIDQIKPTNGSVSILGMDSQKDSVEIKKHIGFLSSDTELDKNLSGWQQLKYYGSLHGKYNEQKIKDLAKRLNCNLNLKFANRSRGNKQKVGLITALMHDPELLILDEPTSGFDPLIQQEFNNIIKEHKAAGKSALISSHVLGEVEEICDEVAFIREGKIISNVNIKKVNTMNHYLVKIVSPDSKLTTKIKKLKNIDKLAISSNDIEFVYTDKINKLNKILANYEFEDLEITKPDLERQFLGLYRGENV